ncbi:MAG: glutamate-5-semialdehyde dehydrogenase [Oscillospiraceae bacterium]
MTVLETQAAAVKTAGRSLAVASTQVKNNALEAIAAALMARQGEILSANDRDVAAARESGMTAAMLDRLTLTPERIAAMAEGVRQVAALPDPIGKTLSEIARPNGLSIRKISVPLGVIGIIFEARPNVTVDAAVLCLKSGNAVLLRGGKEAISSNLALTAVLCDALEAAGLPRNCVGLVADTARSSADEMMNLTDYLDVLIPRGGKGLIRHVVQTAHVPVIRTGEGVCHIYVDENADLAMAADILYNAKCSRPSVCNAAECVLVHEKIAADFWRLAAAKLATKNVEIHGCPATCALVPHGIPAAESDWDAEFGDYILAAKTVRNLDEALDFIARHGTGHSECIVTADKTAAEKFLHEVDAAAVYVNASTRFTDGFEFGLGAEIGISTQKLHARGPMGLEELTSYKYQVIGTGQTRG